MLFKTLIGIQPTRVRIRAAQREGITIAKEKGKFKGRPVRYRAGTNNVRDRMIYDQIVTRLKQSVMDIHKYTGVARMTIYRIKKELVE